MEIEIVTKEDLNDFRMKLLDDISKLLMPSPAKLKPWLKNSEIKKQSLFVKSLNSSISSFHRIILHTFQKDSILF